MVGRPLLHVRESEVLINLSEWLKIPAYKTALNIVNRTSNRYFVGLPLCMCLAVESENLLTIHTSLAHIR